MRKNNAFDFLSKIREGNNGCWEWAGHKRGGYGRFTIKSRLLSAHRYSYELFRKPIPVGLQIDHLCRNKACVNPNHLEVVTNQENCQRRTRLITHCPNGHEYTDDNLVPYALSQGRRACKECQKEYMLNYYKKYKGVKKSERVAI